MQGTQGIPGTSYQPYVSGVVASSNVIVAANADPLTYEQHNLTTVSLADNMPLHMMLTTKNTIKNKDGEDETIEEQLDVTMSKVPRQGYQSDKAFDIEINLAKSSSITQGTYTATARISPDSPVYNIKDDAAVSKYDTVPQTWP